MRVILPLLAAVRLTRLVVTDDLGRWWIHEPIDRAMDAYAERELWTAAHEDRDPVEPWWWKYRSGLDCPFCVGFWICVGTLAAQRALPRPVFTALAAPLALNYVTAHLGSRLGDFDTPAGEEEEDA